MSLKDIYVGNTVNYNLTFTDTNNLPIDVSGWKIFWFFKLNMQDSDSQAHLFKYITLPSSANSVVGKATITLDVADTTKLIFPNRYFYGIKRIIVGSNPIDIQTLNTGWVQTVAAGSTITTEFVHVPNLVGLTSAAAQSLIISNNLVVGTITNKNSITTGSGNIINSDPINLSFVEYNTPINLEVAI